MAGVLGVARGPEPKRSLNPEKYHTKVSNSGKNNNTNSNNNSNINSICNNNSNNNKFSLTILSHNS